MATDLRKQPHNETKEHTSQAGQLTQVQPKTVSTFTPTEGGVTGAIDSSDKLKPYLGVAQGVGFGPEYGWRPGDIVIGKEYGIYRPYNAVTNEKGTDPVRLIVVKAFKNFIERTPQGHPDAPRTFKELPEALAAGLRAHYLDTKDKKANKPTVEPQLNVCALVCRPSLVFSQSREKINCPFFNFELEDEIWAPVLWSISGSASYPAAKSIITFIGERPTYSLEMWLTSKLTVGENTFASPLIKSGPDLKAETVATIKEQLETI